MTGEVLSKPEVEACEVLKPINTRINIQEYSPPTTLSQLVWSMKSVPCT